MTRPYEPTLLDAIAAELQDLGTSYTDPSVAARQLLEEAFAALESGSRQVRRGAA